MSLDFLKQNITKQKKLFAELRKLYSMLPYSRSFQKRKHILRAIQSNTKILRMLNGSIPSLVNNIKVVGKLPSLKKGDVDRISKPVVEEGDDIFFPVSGRINQYGDAVVSISSSERKKYLEDSNIPERYIQDVKSRSGKNEEEIGDEYKEPSKYVSISNKFFFEYSSKLVDEGYFEEMGIHLKKGGFVLLLKSFISVVFFTTLLSVFVAIFLAAFFFLFSFSGGISLVNFAEDNIISKALISFLILIAIPPITFFATLYYPSTEVSTLGAQINAELPFVVIQMAAIASSDVEPTNIFRIISRNKDSPALARESKKIMNQINVYGFDLTTSLKNVAEASPNEKWAELLNGLSSTILSGGSLGNYLGKTSESLLFHYRIDKEKSTKFAETFMGLYISIVIAAPMMIMLLLIIMSVAGIGFPIGMIGISILMSSLVGFINLIFIFYLFQTQKGF